MLYHFVMLCQYDIYVYNMRVLFSLPQTWDVGEFTRTLGAFIFKLEPSDFGMYTCVATNDFGRDEGNLTVYGKWSDQDSSIKIPLYVLYIFSQEGEGQKVVILA